MSRVGKIPVTLPDNVDVSIDKELIIANGPKGRLEQQMLAGIKVTQQDRQIVFTRKNDEPVNRANHGLLRALVQNMVTGVQNGFQKKLEINGVGYRVALSGNELRLSLGFSHPVTYRLPEGITASVEQNIITISGISKQQVGQVAAEIRALKKPEPYKGKGIKYVGERIIRKSGKSGKDK